MSDDSNIIGTPGPEIAASAQSGPSNVASNKNITVTMPESGPGSLGWWWTQIERDERVREKLTPLWKQNLRRYKGGNPNLYGVSRNETITVNVDFANTEAKKPQLCYQTPYINLAATKEADIKIAPLAQSVINSYLAHDIPAAQMLDEVLMDIICPSGIGFTEIGYQAYFGEPITEPVMVPDTGILARTRAAITGQPAPMVPGKNPDGTPQTQQTPNLLYERNFWERFTPAKAIVPSFFDQSDYDQAPYLGRRANEPLSKLEKELGTKIDLSRISTDTRRLSDDTDVNSLDQMVSVVRIWYRSSYVRDDVFDPRRFTQLVLLEGRAEGKRGSEVLVHRDSPYQRIGPRGEFVGGMQGNPINVFTIRYTSDSCWPSSDSTMSRNAVDELCMARSQNIQQRRRNLPLHGVNNTLTSGTKWTVEKLQQAMIQGVIPFDGDPNQILKVIQAANFPNENFKFQEILQTDIASIWSLGVNQTGTPDGEATATASSIADKNSSARMGKERNRFVNGFTRGAAKVFALLQEFSDQTQYVEIIGADGAKQLQAWNKENIGGLYRFTERPDSSVRIDNAQDREVWLRLYNLIANDPNIDRRKLIQTLVEKFNCDPSWFLTPQPPQPQPEEPKISLSFNGEDVSTTNPQAPVVWAILKQRGVDVPDDAKTNSGLIGVGADVQQRQSEEIKHPAGAKQVDHPGHVNQVQTIDQHAADRTGQRPGPQVGGGAERVQ